MKRYDRIFGSGPRGTITSLLLLLVAVSFEEALELPALSSNTSYTIMLATTFCICGLALLTWSVVSLPPSERGRHLVKTGAFKYFRHPLYAAFLLFFNVGLAFLLNNWVYIIWALVLHPIWAINVRKEEKLMLLEFGKEYEEYCANTWRFLPKPWK